jgi:drug/metabolite transporter (DMT)-like permease
MGFNPETFSLVWTTAATVYAFLIVLGTGLRRELVLKREHLIKVITMGVTTGAGMILIWSGLAQLDPSFAAFLMRFFPVLTILLSAIFLHEKLSLVEIFPIGLMVLGGCISALGRWNIVGMGMVLILTSCLAGAVQMLMAKMKVSEIHPNVLVFYRVGIADITILLWILVTGKADFDVGMSYWGVTLLGAFLGPCASFLLTFRSYKYWYLSRSSMVRTAQPLFVLPLAYIFLHKLPEDKELLGGFLILIGAFWIAWLHFRKRGNK